GVGVFELSGDVVETAVEGAEGLVAGQAEGAVADAADGLDGVDDVENGEGFGGGNEGEAAIFPALGVDEAGADEGLHDLGKVVGGDLSGGGERLSGDGGVGVGGEPDDGAEGVFGGAGHHSWICG